MSTPVTAPVRNRGLLRWTVALVATLLLVVSGSGLVAFAQDGAAGSQGPQFAPAGSPFYAEVRLDMPDGQGDALAQLLTAFPGFADAESFPTKREEIIDSLVEMVGSEDAEEISGLLASLTGEIGLAVTSLSAEDMESDEPPMVIGLAITDRPTVEAALAAAAEDDATTETYGAATLLSDDQTTIGITDGWILISPEADEVKGAVDTLAGTNPSLAADPKFTSAFARVPAGHLAALYVDFQALAPIIEAGMAAGGGMAFGMPMPMTDVAAQLPTDMVAYLVAEPDRLSLEAAITPSEAMSALPVGESDLANAFPAETQLYIETRDLGATLAGALTTVLAGAGEESAAQMAPIEDMLGAPLPEFLSFIGDAGIGAGVSPGSLWLGIAAETTDEALATERVNLLLGMLQLFASSPEAGVSVETQTVGDTEVSVITLPIDSAEMGMPFDIGQTISVAVADGELLIGTGDFVTNAITGDESASLGASEAWTDALGDDTTNSGIVYANIGSLLAQLDPMLSMLVPEWPEIAPYATAVDRFVAVGTAADDVISARMTIIVSAAE